MGRSLLTIFITLLSTIFTQYNNRLYVPCYRDAEHMYVYDDSGNIYEELDSTYIELFQHPDLQTKPMLYVLPVDDDDVTLTEVALHCYHATYRESCALITNIQNAGYSLTYTIQTPEYVDMLLSNESAVFRLILTKDGTLRIYPNESDKIDVFEPYINER